MPPHYKVTEALELEAPEFEAVEAEEENLEAPELEAVEAEEEKLVRHPATSLWSKKESLSQLPQNVQEIMMIFGDILEGFWKN